MRVVWSRAALADLEAIRDHIAADSPDRAVSFVWEITEAGAAIGDMPKAFPLVPRLEHRGVRRRLFGAYLIFYRINEGRVEVLHVTHGARDYVRHLFED